MDTYVISDTHFNHTKLAEIRGFNSANEMNELILDNWVSKVNDKDTVIHLGDVVFGLNKVDWLDKYFKTLPGKKYLILGNHDNPKFLLSFFKEIALWKYDKYNSILYTHAPQHESILTERRFDSGVVLNIHGHIHENKSPNGKYLCACVEQTNFNLLKIVKK